jgi:hypothetical protein
MPSGELEALAAKVEAVLKDPALRARQLAVFAESRAFIHSHNSSLWLTHVLPDRIRLFAGRLIVMTLSGDTAWVTIDPQHDEQLSVLRSWKWDTGSYARYKRVPSRNGFYRPSDDNNDQDWSVIRESHFAYLNYVLARTRGIDPRSAARHEPLMAEYLGTVLRREALTSGWVASPEEIAGHAGYWEGAMVRVSVNRFERDRSARDECLVVSATSVPRAKSRSLNCMDRKSKGSSTCIILSLCRRYGRDTRPIRRPTWCPYVPIATPWFMREGER